MFPAREPLKPSTASPENVEGLDNFLERGWGGAGSLTGFELAVALQGGLRHLGPQPRFAPANL